MGTPDTPNTVLLQWISISHLLNGKRKATRSSQGLKPGFPVLNVGAEAPTPYPS
jgi:hypothetical protein